MAFKKQNLKLFKKKSPEGDFYKFVGYIN